MKIKTFKAPTMADALIQIKKEFGKDAVILNTRTVDKKRVLGAVGRSHVEITAAPDASHLPPAITRGTVPMRSRRRPQPASAPTPTGYVQPNAPTRPSDTHVQATSSSLFAEIGEIKSLVRGLVHNSRHALESELPGELMASYQKLVQNQVADGLAREMIQSVRDRLDVEGLSDASAVRRELSTILQSMLPAAGPIRAERRSGATFIALVGPTGVGKTTTTAKLAANFSLREGKRVGLITIDTYRIAAVEQLRTYADIIDIPLEVAGTPDDFERAARCMRDCDVVLVDTAGRSQRDDSKIEHLQEFFVAVPPHEVHLVLPATANEAVLCQAVERFSPLGADRIILTKMDEAVGFGVVLACLKKANAALSYVTTGQDVPDDIEIGKSSALADMLISGGEYVRSESA